MSFTYLHFNRFYDSTFNFLVSCEPLKIFMLSGKTASIKVSYFQAIFRMCARFCQDIVEHTELYVHLYELTLNKSVNFSQKRNSKKDNHAILQVPLKVPLMLEETIQDMPLLRPDEMQEPLSFCLKVIIHFTTTNNIVCCRRGNQQWMTSKKLPWSGDRITVIICKDYFENE